MRAWTPQELLPIMPPMVQRLWVAGSGAKVRLNFSASSRTRSSTMPGWTLTVRLTVSIASMPFMYLEKSRMTAKLQPWPAREVPAPRVRMGASKRRQSGDGVDYVLFIVRDDDADGDVAVVGGVGGVEGVGGGIEADFAADLLAEELAEFVGGREGVDGAGVGARQDDEGGGGHTAHYTAAGGAFGGGGI